MCLFSPNTDALTPLRSHATPDRAPDHLAEGTPAALRDDLIALLGHTAVRSRVTDLVKYATDASPCRFFPQVVIVAESVEQIAKTLQYATQNHRSVTFRASGSSLNGQSQEDDLLIDVRDCFNGIEVLADGRSDLAPASERASPITLCPALISSSTTAEPTKLVAPVTNIFIGPPCFRHMEIKISAPIEAPPRHFWRLH
jgi:hypothetical protein